MALIEIEKEVLNNLEKKIMIMKNLISINQKKLLKILQIMLLM